MRQIATLTLDGASRGFVLKTVYEEKEAAKAVGGRWSKELRAWKLPLDVNLERMARLLRLRVDDQARSFIEQRAKKWASIARWQTASDAEGPAELAPYQRVGVRFLTEAGSAILADDVGLGKGHPEGTKILTPTGWNNIEELKVGDSVIGADGKTCRVTGVYSRGILPVYKVWFNDKTSIVCDEDHLWAVRTVNDQQRGKPWRVISTKNLINTERQGKWKHRRWRIPVVKPIEFAANKALPLDPYLLGVLIGDGGLIGHSVKFTKADLRVVEEVRRGLPSGVELRLEKSTKSRPSSWHISSEPKFAPNPVVQSLRKLGLMGLHSYEKFIPEPYLFALITDRIALLQGLLDTDGEIYADYVGYDTTSYRLAQDVIFLVQSLGGIARLRTKAGRYNKEGRYVECKMCYRITIALPPEILPTRIKIDKYSIRTKYLPNRLIDRIEPVGVANVVCIAVDAPGRLYVTENCIVTHNTVQAIHACHEVKANKRLIIAKKSLLYNWCAEIEKWLGLSVINVLTTRNHIDPVADWVITNPEVVVRRLDELLQIKWGALIVDEAHIVRNRKSQRSKAIFKLADKVKHRFLLTGTPAPNNLPEIWSLLHIIDPDYYSSYWRFIDRHGDTYKNYWGGIEILGVKDEVALAQELAPRMIRRTKALLNLPPISYETIYLQMEGEQERIYRDLRTRLLSEVSQGKFVLTPNLLSMMTRLRQVLCSPALIGGPDESVKTQALLDLLDQTEGKTLVFTSFAEYVRLLKPQLQQYGVATITGGMSAEQRWEAARAFQEDPQTRVLVGTIPAMGEGYNLQAADLVILLNEDWVPANNEQVIGRAYRRGQTKPVHVVTLITKGTIDEHVRRILEGKEAVVEQVLLDSLRREHDSMLYMRPAS